MGLCPDVHLEIFVLEKYWCLIYFTEILRKGQISPNKGLNIVLAMSMYLKKINVS